jgi:hypothetical protein
MTTCYLKRSTDFSADGCKQVWNSGGILINLRKRKKLEVCLLEGWSFHYDSHAESADNELDDPWKKPDPGWLIELQILWFRKATEVKNLM